MAKELRTAKGVLFGEEPFPFSSFRLAVIQQSAIRVRKFAIRSSQLIRHPQSLLQNRARLNLQIPIDH